MRLDEVPAGIGRGPSRDLPIVKDGRITGLLFPRDLLRHKVEGLTAQLDTLHEVLSVLRSAGVD